MATGRTLPATLRAKQSIKSKSATSSDSSTEPSASTPGRRITGDQFTAVNILTKKIERVTENKNKNSREILFLVHSGK